MKQLILIIFIFSFLSISGWFIDTVIDYNLNTHEKEIDFKEFLYKDISLGEICERSIIVFCFVISGSSIYFVLRKLKKNTKLDINKYIFYKRAFDQCAVSIIITDLDGKIISVNRKTSDLYGYRREEIEGKMVGFLNAEPNAIEIQKNIMEVVRKGEVWKGKFLNFKKDGSVFLIEADITSIEDQNENIIAYIGFQKDLSILQELEYDKSITYQKYQFIFDAAPLFLNFVNEKGIIIDCNDMCETLLGYSKEELIGEHYSKIIHSSYLGKAKKEMSLLKENKNIPTKFSEYKMIKKDGTIIDVHARTISFSDSSGKFLHTVCFIIDVSERIQREMDLENIALELTHSNQELEQFAYAASHDLQEPLRIIASYCQLLKNKYLEIGGSDKEITKWIDYSIAASERMKIFIKELLDFSRVGKKDKPLEKIDLKEIINEVTRDLSFVIEEKQAIIELESDIPTVYCIKFRIKQLFRNLISNSLKFCKKDEAPKINISVCENNTEYLFCVKDNGIGINPKYFDRIFGIFKRLYSKEEYPGTGIGLALCKKIVETHGGKIWVDSDEGIGTSFYFTLLKRDSLKT
jgi:PAS domain S-box-containing protein